MENTQYVVCLSREPDPEREVPRLRRCRQVDPAQVLLRGLSAGGRLRGGQYGIPDIKSPFTLNVSVKVLENNGSNGNKTQTQSIRTMFILCVNVNVSMDTMLKLDAKVDANVDLTLNVNAP